MQPILEVFRELKLYNAAFYPFPCHLQYPSEPSSYPYHPSNPSSYSPSRGQSSATQHKQTPRDTPHSKPTSPCDNMCFRMGRIFNPKMCQYRPPIADIANAPPSLQSLSHVFTDPR